MSLRRPFAPKMSNKGLKGPKMPCVKPHIPCPALILDAPLCLQLTADLIICKRITYEDRRIFIGCLKFISRRELHIQVDS